MKVQQGLILGVVAAAILISGGILLYSQHTGTVEQTHNPALAQRYIPYSPEVLTKAEQHGGRTVIFFAALAWCSDCQAADRDFKAHFDKVPSDVSIIIANYDKEIALKQFYGIAAQDTFIQVDQHGNPITEWTSGGQGVQALLDNIQQT
jgi:hypothetical protein